jgi:hypothetical protein
MNHSPTHENTTHTHGAGVALEPEARAILARGLGELLRMTEGLAFRPSASERYPLPLAQAVYDEIPDPEVVRQRVIARRERDPVSALEDALVLFELYASNQPDLAGLVPDDSAFLSQTFRTKRSNGWIGVLGETEPGEVEARVNAQWRFKVLPGSERRTALYPLLSMVARYGFVYGRVTFGDSHALGHFIEDYAPALLVCRGQLDDLELVLSLAAMKIGVPAVTPLDYPFSLGRQLQVDALDEMGGSLAAFPSLHRLMPQVPGVPALPDYLDPRWAKEEFERAARWGDTEESFYVLRKGTVDVPGAVAVTGEPSGPMGVIVTAEAEPLDAFDRGYIEGRAARALSTMKGVLASICDGKLVLDLAADTALTPARVGETLIAAIRHEFPKIERVRAEVIFDPVRLNDLYEAVCAELSARDAEVASATEESLDMFATCVGCSPFAPDHACVLTPERPPQCNRHFETIKTDALYSYDDMSNIHHRILHAGINSFGVCPKGEAIDSVAGEWSGANEAVSRLTGGRTTRVQLHSLDAFPHTGCSCFQLIMFKTAQPRPGIGIMRRGYKGRAPDGRTWGDLHYALTGKQTPGMAGASPGYLRSEKFLRAHGGWKAVVWVSPEIAGLMGEGLPEHVTTED